jgi:hypothetical protein
MKNAVFWYVLPCSYCVNRRFRGMYCLPFCPYISGCFRLALSLQPPAHALSSLADFSILKMEAIRSSETSVHTRTTRRHIPENGILLHYVKFVTV